MNVAHSFVAPPKKFQVAARMSAILLKALVPSVPALPRGSCRTEHSIGRHYFIHPGFIPLSSNCQNGDMLDMSFMFFFQKWRKFPESSSSRYVCWCMQDYPETQRTEILDLLFKPQSAAAVGGPALAVGR